MVDHSHNERNDIPAAPLEQWLDEYKGQAFWRAPAWSPSERGQYLQAIWGCWTELWLQAVAACDGHPPDASQLALEIRGTQDGSHLNGFGGDPLRAAFLEQVILTDPRFRLELNYRFDRYWQDLFQRSMTAADPRRTRYLKRMSGVWAHHWNTAIEQSRSRYASGLRVIRRIRAGKGYARGGVLGGDPLRDVVLAEAVQNREPSARTIFEQQYKGSILDSATRVDGRINDYWDDWWHDFSVWLFGDADPPGKLLRFGGKCGLSNWLDTVARRYVFAELKKRRRTVPLDSCAEPAVFADQVAEDDFLAKLRADIQQALDQLPARQRCVLVMVYFEDRPQIDVARVLGVHKGQVTRIKQKALGKMRSFLSGNGYGPGSFAS